MRFMVQLAKTAGDKHLPRTLTTMSDFPHIPLDFHRLAPEEQLRRSREFLATMQGRRTVRDFSPEPVPFELIENAIRTAASAPSGANQQPWRFVAVSDPEVKRKIRLAAEEEEREFYHNRAPDEWLQALAPLGTDEHKPFLEIAPWLIVVFRLDYTPATDADGNEVRRKHYYVQESVGIACGLLLASLHLAGLATLTHTPSPMGFLAEVLGRPAHERPYLLIPVGFPAEGAQVPKISKRNLSEVMSVLR